MKRLLLFLMLAPMLMLPQPPGVLAESEDEAFGGDFSSGFGSEVDLGGVLRFDTRVTADYVHPEKSPVESHPELYLDLDYRGESSDVVANLEIRPDYLEAGTTARDFAEALVDETYVSLYYDRLTLSAGYLKRVWGTGDQIHVVDVLNSTDFRDFVNPDYLERRLARPMLHLAFDLGPQGRLETAYLPVFQGDTIPQDGRWVPSDVRELLALVGETPVLEPETSTLEWGQFGARYRNSFGRVDLGVIYYHGFLKQPSVVFDTPTGGPESFTEDDQVLLDYDRVNVFGMEYAAVLGGFNTRGELAYSLTKDISGDDPQVTNPSLGYLAGVDRDLPVSSLNVNLQLVGEIVLGSGEIESNVEEQSTFDFQYDEDGEYTSHIVSLALTDSYANNRIRPEAALSYGIEDRDYYLNPSLEFSLVDDALLRLEAAFFLGEEGYFGQFEDNDYLELRFEYAF
ncbi:MAG: DUF1302 family protein [Spirochaetota bacterium]